MEKTQVVEITFFFHHALSILRTKCSSTTFKTEAKIRVQHTDTLLRWLVTKTQVRLTHHKQSEKRGELQRRCNAVVLGNQNRPTQGTVLVGKQKAVIRG